MTLDEPEYILLGTCTLVFLGLLSPYIAIKFAAIIVAQVFASFLIGIAGYEAGMKRRD